MHFKLYSIGVASVCFVPSAVSAQALLSDVNGFSITFDATLANVNNGAYAASGMRAAPNAGELDSDAWAIQLDGTAYTSTYSFGGTLAGTPTFQSGTGTGGVSTGGLYRFDVNDGGTSRAFGLQPSGSAFTLGSVALRVQNDTGLPLTKFTLSYEIWERNDQAGQTNINLAYSTDNATFTFVPAASYTTVAASSGATALAKVATRMIVVEGLNVADDASFILRFGFEDGPDGSGSRDEIALDDIAVSVPEPASMFVVGASVLMLARKRRAG